MKSILVLVFNNLNHDARVNRQIEFLERAYKITVVSFEAPLGATYEHVAIRRIKPSLYDKLLGGLALLFRRYSLAYRVIYKQPEELNSLSNRNFDIIIANDIETLPLAFSLSTNSKILFDAHEYAPRHFEDKLVWRLFFKGLNEFLCKKYLPKIDSMITVCDGLAREYAKYFPVNPIVLTNANYYCEYTPTATNSEEIKLVHHGAANPSRKLELMIEVMNYLDDRFTLDMILLTPAIANKKTRKYLDYLHKLVAINPRITIIPPVQSKEVVAKIHKYDVGLFLIPPINFNYENTLPNKLFDFIQGRLAIAIGPTPEMVKIVKAYDLGVVSDSFSPKAFAKVINGLTASKIDYFKNKSNQAAQELSAEKNREILNSIVSNLLKD